MDITLSLVAPDTDAQRLQTMTRDLARAINAESDVRATLPEGEATAGVRGDPVVLHQIALDIGTKAAAIVVSQALLALLRPQLERLPSLRMVLRRKDGAALTLSQHDVASEILEETVEAAARFLQMGG